MVEKIRILDVRKHFQEELLANLHEIELKGRPEIKPYKDADIKVMLMDPERIWPAQRYVLEPELKKIELLRWSLENLGHNLFDLDGYLSIKVEGLDGWIDVLPPVVEASIEPRGKVALLNDGMHRVYLARVAGQKIRVAYVDGVPPEYPYYAYPLPGRWNDVEIIDKLVDGYRKKFHRIEDHRSLYRDFNTGGFNDVGSSRSAA